MESNRRQFSGHAALAFAGLALTHLEAADSKSTPGGAAAAGNGPDRPRPEFGGGLHHPAKAKRIVQIFLNGGMSQIDTFDRKPELDRQHGRQVEFGLKASATGTVGPLMKCPFAWKRHGESGRWVTEVFPHLARHVDDMAFLMAMQSTTDVHGIASFLQNTGFTTPGFPCLGAWVSYGLGRLTDNLPTFVVLPDPRGLPYNNMGNFSAGFLPSNHRATVVNGSDPRPIRDLAPPPGSRFASSALDEAGLALLAENERAYADHRPGDPRLAARIDSYRLAARMQLAAPEAFDLARETGAALDRYGVHRPGHEGGFARNCVLARRLLERGVRFVQVWSGMEGAAHNWDNHGSIPGELPPIARQVDQPVAALLADLKATGLLADTLVVFTTEFGRMPFTQNSVGRDHNGGTFVTWVAGAGIRAGVAHGASDEWSFKAATGKTTGHDLHATLLHLLGVDHTRLTVRHNGIDRRVTDVHGRVIREILA
jgi:hypothetical protein